MPDEATLNAIKETLGYTDAQWESWKRNPRNLKIVDNLESFGKHKLVAEVVGSYGCAAGHKVGDRIVFADDGSLLCRESPEKVCQSVLALMLPAAAAVLDRKSNGEDVAQFAFSKLHCGDVGVEDGGWGEVVLEVKVEAT